MNSELVNLEITVSGPFTPTTEPCKAYYTGCVVSNRADFTFGFLRDDIHAAGLVITGEDVHGCLISIIKGLLKGLESSHVGRDL